MSDTASPPMSTPPSTLVGPGTSNGRHPDERPPDLQLQRTVRLEDSIGQFSYGPATQTTVVTTTTTTTTKFPPLMLRAPRHLNNLDPQEYPLAASPTPDSIKKLVFKVDGKSTTFQEAEHTLQTVQKLNEQVQALAESHGSYSSISNDPGAPKDAGYGYMASPTSTLAHRYDPPQKAGAKRSASPVSISEAAKLAAQERPRKRRLTSEQRGNQKKDERRSRLRQSHLQSLQTSTPITPQADADPFSRPQQITAWRAPSPRDLEIDDPTSAKSSTSSTVSPDPPYEAEPQILSPRSEDGRVDPGPSGRPLNQSFIDLDPASDWEAPIPGNVMNAQLDGDRAVFDDRHQAGILAPDRSRLQSRPRPQALNTTAAQDGSLPSPSLSPVTAAAQLNARTTLAENSRLPARYDDGNAFRSAGPHRRRKPETSQSPRSVGTSKSLIQAAQELPDAEENGLPTHYARRSLMCIPQVVDDFESMPEEMKKYVMYQLLRRCSKPVLHFVSGVVNPALKCDFLTRLPPELCEVILGNLNFKSLCAAAQVSKKWRQQVDLSEKVWKRIFYEDGYSLQEGELARAIREGWGWQTISEPGESEQDLSLQVASTSDAPPPGPLTPSDSMNASYRSKRRGRAKAGSASRPLRKRKQMPLVRTPEMDEDALLVMTSASDGPYATASAAAAAISLPPSDLHLWKSIYMRHYIIRKTWLQEEVAPRHIAFRAHQRHVVTCLQFDSEKILTGSDDANINVYDTQTGAQRAKLEGHEGGVWALQYEGNVLVSGSTDRSVRVWDIERGICTHTFQGHTSTVRCLQILMPTPIGRGPDGRVSKMPKQPLVITGSRDSHLRVWKLPAPGDPSLHQAGPAQDESTECPYFVRTLIGHHHSVRAIAAHADTLVSGSYDFTVRVWKISTGETLHRLQGHTAKVYSVVLDNKRNRCISGSMDNVVRVWSLDSGMALFNLEGHSSLVGLLDLQQDRLVSAAADSTLRIWDPQNGQCKSTLSAHTGAITCFQHDGQKVISGSDRTLKMWNVANGEFVKDLLTDLSGVWQVKFNERRCVAAVQRNSFTFIEVLDFGACRDGYPESQRGRRILVDAEGKENLGFVQQNREVDPLDGN